MDIALSNVVRTVVDPANETGHVGAWALDFGLPGKPHLRVIEALANAPVAPPRADEIFVWFAAPIVKSDVLLQAAAWQLNTLEREKVQRLHQDADRSNYIAAHAGLRVILGAALGIPPLDVRMARGPRGKPTLCARWHTEPISRGTQFNISHTRGLVAVALAGCPIGIDIEKPRVMDYQTRIANSVFAQDSVSAFNAASTDDERNVLFYRFWTLGEAFIKATGHGISQGLRSFAFNANGPPLLTRVTTGWGPIERWRFGQF